MENGANNAQTMHLNGFRIMPIFVRLSAALLSISSLFVDASLRASTVTYVYTDPKGTPLAEADASGNITLKFEYSPYGQGVQGQASANPGYAGHVSDPESEFIYMQARYYDSQTGRFLSIDPHPVVENHLFFFNRFAYANNSPERYSDEHGDRPGDKFATPEMAAHDALSYINGTSILVNREFQGYVVMSEGSFYATEPVQLSAEGGLTPPPGVPGIVGDYHTHGNYSLKLPDGSIVLTGDPASDNLNSDQFSRQDVNRYDSLVKRQGVYRGYLGTPSGKFYVYYKGKVYDLTTEVENQQKEQQERKEREKWAADLGQQRQRERSH